MIAFAAGASPSAYTEPTVQITQSVYITTPCAYIPTRFVGCISIELRDVEDAVPYKANLIFTKKDASRGLHLFILPRGPQSE